MPYDEERVVSRNVIPEKVRCTSCVTFVDQLVKLCEIPSCFIAGKKIWTSDFHTFSTTEEDQATPEVTEEERTSGTRNRKQKRSISAVL